LKILFCQLDEVCADGVADARLPVQHHPDAARLVRQTSMSWLPPAEPICCAQRDACRPTSLCRDASRILRVLPETLHRNIVLRNPPTSQNCIEFSSALLEIIPGQERRRHHAVMSTRPRPDDRLQRQDHRAHCSANTVTSGIAATWW
jgi:hypothetical protein